MKMICLFVVSATLAAANSIGSEPAVLSCSFVDVFPKFLKEPKFKGR
jgi:hypothetical protein